MMLATLFVASLLLQDAERPQPPSFPTFTPDQVEVTTYRVKNMDPSMFSHVLNMFRRHIQVTDEGLSPRPVDNMTVWNDSVVIYDSPEYSRKVISMLEQIDAASAAQEVTGLQMLEAIQYRPKHLSAQALHRALRPFQMEVTVSHPTGGRRGVHNIDVVPDANVLVIRDTPERIGEILEFVETIDVEPARVTIGAMLVQASHGEGSARVPEDLTAALSQMVPFESFELLSMGMITSAVERDDAILLTLETPYDVAELRIGSARLDDERTSLSFDCEFIWGSIEFAVSTRLDVGEYTVLGATGAEPVFVVLKLVTMD